MEAYSAIQAAPSAEVAPPVGPVDFHDGTAKLVIGNLRYAPAVNTIFRYYGRSIIAVYPSKSQGEPGSISAVFTDECGREVLRLRQNEWIGALDSWDTEVIGPRITVRRKHREIAFHMRLEPPGQIVVERLDMRFGEAHILASEETYAVGRYFGNRICWVHAEVIIQGGSESGIAIDVCSLDELRVREALLGGKGRTVANRNGRVIINSHTGVMIKPLGVSIAAMTGGFLLRDVSIGQRRLGDMRKAVFQKPESIDRFIGTGEFDR